MQSLLRPNSPRAAAVRRALEEYHEARRRVQKLKLERPSADRSWEDHQGFERLAKAGAVAEQMARESLSRAVEAYTGKLPCAVIVDSPGGSSVVAVSGTPEGTIVVTAADRLPIKDVLCRPEPPPEFAHAFRQMAPSQSGIYVVMQRGDVVAIYNGVYFRSTNGVAADLQKLIEAGLAGVWSDESDLTSQPP